MKKQIRQGVFETNSSSTHSLTLCTGEEYEKWQEGSLLFNMDREAFITLEEYNEKIAKCKTDSEREYYKGCCFGPKEYEDYVDNNFYSIHESIITPSGEEVVAFGYYGYDG